MLWLHRLELNRQSILGVGVGGVADEEDGDDVEVVVEVRAGWKWTESFFSSSGTNTTLAFQQ